MIRDEDIDRRYEERIKGRDKKIEDLKQNVFMLEETIINLKKKYEVGSQSDLMSTGNRYKEMYHELASSIERENQKAEEDKAKQI